MRKIVLSEFVSLDGVIEHPMWTFEFGCDDQNNFKFAELQASDALLLGRVTYEGFAASWPNMIEQTGEYGQWMNGYPKYVVSSTLDKAEWNNSHVIKGDLVEEINKLKRQPGKDIVVFGSGALVQTLMKHDLIDEYRLMVFPVVVGSGQKLFTDGLDKKSLKLAETKTFSSGTVVLTYHPVRND